MPYRILLDTNRNGRFRATPLDYDTLDLARWWAINWLKNGYVPVRVDDGHVEELVPASEIRRVMIREV